MARPKPDEDLVLVAFKLPRSVWERLEREGLKYTSPETALSYKSVPMFSRKIVLDWLKKRGGESKNQKKK